ncbi:hypothetical protein HaLaN_26651 [Haematococcus lacustris]|uniref:Uncharacterized protein n=1 Tax=Haematococcus lacustris TaxID=44745 RepID=A0A6A0A6L4_HAELA|nr:hypothetical protein HaLaN_26651 [Haematococcus lacustris]
MSAASAVHCPAGTPPLQTAATAPHPGSAPPQHWHDQHALMQGQRVYARCFVLNGLAGPSTDSPAKQRPPTPAEHSPGPI